MLDTWGMADWLILSAGVFYSMGYLVINQMILRILLLIGTTLFITYYAVVAAEPLWGAIYTSLTLGTANLIGLFSLWRRQQKWLLPANLREIHALFPNLPPGDLRDLYKLADDEIIPEPRRLTTEDSPVDRLYYVFDGHVTMVKKGVTVPLPDKIFLGEIGFLLGCNATATTYVAQGARLISWERKTLDKIRRRKPRLLLALDAAISRDMATKVARSHAPSEMAKNKVTAFDTLKPAK